MGNQYFVKVEQKWKFGKTKN